MSSPCVQGLSAPVRDIFESFEFHTQIDKLAKSSLLFGNFEEVSRDGVPISRIFKNEAFGYRTITVERPARDAQGKVILAARGRNRGKPEPDADLRDTENVPLSEDVETYFKREVLPHAPDAWIDPKKTKVGYEIPFNRHFYVFKPPRPLAEIDAELRGVTDRILTMIAGCRNEERSGRTAKPPP